jgi:hypothetical protein
MGFMQSTKKVADAQNVVQLMLSVQELLEERNDGMNENVTKKEIIVFLAIMLAMFGTLIYGFFFVGAGKMDNCWDQFQTEEQAILNCEQ